MSDRNMTNLGQKMPDVSVVIPCFNREMYIALSIESAMLQGDNVEVIVVDDGSTDSSWSVIESFPQVIGIRSVNEGPSSARNKGIAAARGRYIQFLDADDLLAPAATKFMLDAARQLGAQDIAFGMATAFGRSDNNKVDYGFANYGPGPLLESVLLSRVMPCWLPLFPKDALLSIGGFNSGLSIGEDYELAVRAHAAGYRFIQIPQYTYLLRDHDGPRLTRCYGARGFDRQLQALELAVANLTDGSANRPTKDGATGVAQLAWRLGREAAREQCRTQAERLFGFAVSLVGSDAWVGNAVTRTLYNFLDPYVAERLIQAGKELVSPFIGPRK